MRQEARAGGRARRHRCPGRGGGQHQKAALRVRLLKKLGWIKSTVRPGDWCLVLGVEKERERQGGGAVKEWASIEALRYMAGVVHTKAEWEILALAALSCAHCLGASEAITARAEGSELVFRGTKSRSGEQRQEMGQWTAKWAAFLARLRACHGYHPDVPAWFQGTDGLHRGLHSILERPRGSFKYLRWHSFRRFGAAQLHGLGLPVRFIMLQGGGVEVGDSGGDILQGAAAMAVRARGTHPPTGVRDQRNDGADAAWDDAGDE